MQEDTLYALRFPIGKFIAPNLITSTNIQSWIDSIQSFPEKLYQLTASLNKEEKNWRYRPQGWTIKQVVHHCADSHMNSLIRFKLALTEDQPTIKPYAEEKWANLSDSIDDHLAPSLALIKALHYRWTLLLDHLSEEQLQRQFIHPSNGESISLKENIGIYAWHGEHHLAHIRQAIKYKGNFSFKDQ